MGKISVPGKISISPNIGAMSLSKISTSSIFTPASLSGLILWLKADDISGNDGDAITSWTDASTSAANAGQSVAGQKPTLKKGVNGINGHNVARFDGGDDLTNAGLSGRGTGAFSIFIVHKVTGSTGVRSFFNLGNVAAGAVMTVNNTNNQYLLNAYGSGVNIVTDSAAVADISEIVIARGIGDTNYKIQRFGSVEASSTPPINCPNGYVIGAADDVGTQFYLGDIAEIIVYNTSLSVGNTTSITDYLQSKYSI